MISRSLTALSPNVQSIQPNTAVDLAEALGINTDNHVKMVNQLQNTPINDILSAQTKINWNNFCLDKPMYSGLSMEDEKDKTKSFITKSLIESTRNGDFNCVPMMLSTTNMEGLLFNSTIIPNSVEMTNISIHIPFDFGINRTIVEEEVNKFYFSNPKKINESLINFWGDIWFKHGAHRTVEIASKYQKIYMANFGLDTKLNVVKLSDARIKQFPGACHADDDSYIYAKSASPQIAPNSLEELWMKRMVRLQSNFVRYSNPTPFYDRLLMNIKWKPYNCIDKNILRLRNDEFDIVNGNNVNFEFWDRLYETYAPGK